jgi:hypothetical protein
MFRTTQVSHILLLVFLGWVIYQFSKDTVGIKNKGVVELSESENDEMQEDEMQENEMQENEESENDEMPEMENNEVEDNDVNTEQIVNENELPESEDLNDIEDVNNFKPEKTSGGASLDKAFEKPIPSVCKTDTVDFNKNFQKKFNSKDYLPNEVNDDWFSTDFSQAKHKMDSDKLVNVQRYVVGINTVGQSLKNASHDIRGTIPNPKYTVSPWNNSTYEPDYNIKPLC